MATNTGEPKKFKLPFVSATYVASTEAKLVELFRNRAELKKQFAELRDERDELMERLEKAQESSEGDREISEKLESLLSDRVNGLNVVLYCMFRHVWRCCYEELAKIKQDLASRQIEVDRAKFFEGFNQKKAARLSASDRSLSALDAELRAARAAREQHESTLAELTGFWNYFSRRRLQPKLEEAKRLESEAEARYQEVKAKRDEIEADQGPEFPGLSVASKRLINVAILALSQHLYVLWSEHDIANMCYTSMNKSVFDARFGEEEDVRFLMAQVEQILQKMAREPDRKTHLKERVAGLRQSAEYADEDSAIPETHCMDYVTRAARSDTALTDRAPIAANVIEKDFWSVNSVLIP